MSCPKCGHGGMKPSGSHGEQCARCGFITKEDVEPKSKSTSTKENK